MFKFADDVAHHNSEAAIAAHPDLAKNLSTQMSSHTFSYTLSLRQLNWEKELDELHTVVETILKPYGWVVYKLQNSNAIRIQARKP